MCHTIDGPHWLCLDLGLQVRVAGDLLVGPGVLC